MISSNLFDKPWWKVVKWLIVLAAYGYMAYQLAMYDDYASLRETIRCTMHARKANVPCTIFIVATLLLMPINILLESCKWRFLNQSIEPISLREAQRQVYCGFIGAFITPYRVGDYPARAMGMRDQSHWAPATVMGFVGSVALTLVIIVFGLCSLLPYSSTPIPQPEGRYLWQIGLAVAGCLLFGLLTPKILNKYLTSEHQLSSRHFTGAIGWSILRYIVFAMQFYLVLRWAGLTLTLTEAIVSIPFYYLLVTVTPNMPIADVGIRGSWAMIVFNRFGAVPLITAAVVVLYVINTLLPTLIGSILTLCRKS